MEPGSLCSHQMAFSKGVKCAGEREASSGLSLGGQVPKTMPGSWGRSSTN